MQPHQIQALLDKYARGACSGDEERLVNDWYHTIGMEEQTALEESERKIIGERVWTAINPQPDRAGKSTFLPWLIRAAAITIPLLACAAFYLNRQTLSTLIIKPLEGALQQEEGPNRFVNSTDHPRQITLRDGSEVLLQPFSEINVHKDFGIETRELRLKGEAFFEVTRDEHRPFVVYTKEVVTRVLGTSFNIRAYEKDQEITVAVKTGKVSVYANKSKASGAVGPNVSEEVILTPNQKMVYHRLIEKVSKKLVEKPEVIIPDSDLFRMHFENEKVGKIFNVLEDNYGIEIRYDAVVLSNCKLTTSMSDEGLYERISVICKAIGASYSIDDGAVITIQSNGC